MYSLGDSNALYSNSATPTRTVDHPAHPSGTYHLYILGRRIDVLPFHSNPHSLLRLLRLLTRGRSSRQIYVLSLPDSLPSSLPSGDALPPSLPYRAFASSGLRDEREQQRPTLLSPPFCVVSLVDYNYVGCGSIAFAFHPLKRSLAFQPGPLRPFTSVWSSLVSIQRHANIPPSQLHNINS